MPEGEPYPTAERSPATALGGQALLLAAALIFFLLIGGSDAGRFATPLRTIGAVLASLIVGRCLTASARFGDRSDRLVVLALLAFVATCVTSQFPRFSFEAATTALALTAGFLLAREAVRSERRRELLIAALGLSGVILAMAFGVLWGLVWARWLSIPTAGIPPLDLILPVGPFRHYHVVAMTVSILLPAVVAMAGRRGAIRLLAVAGILASGAVIVMAGSRTVWLATALGLTIPLALRHRHAIRRLPRIAYLGAAAGLVLVTALIVTTPILSRIAGTSTIALRSEIWSATIDRWLASPLVGSGPGSFSATLTLGDYYSRFPDVGRHADNAVIQLLAEGGLLGLAGLGLLVAALVVGMRAGRALGWAPASGVLIFVLSSFTDNPSDTTALVVIALAWAALASPRVTPEPDQSPPPARSLVRFRVLMLAAGTGVAAAVASTLVAGWSFDQATGAARRGDAPSVEAHLSDAIRFDPGLALYRRERGVWRLAAGQLQGSQSDLAAAYAMNPADATTARSLALLASSDGTHDIAILWARRAVELRRVHAENLLTLAYVARRGGDDQLAAEALTEVLRRDPWTAAAPDWAAAYPSAGVLQRLIADAETVAAASPADGRLAVADAWLAASVGELPRAGTPSDAVASAAVVACRVAEAEATIEAMSHAEAVSADGLRARVLVARATGSSGVDDIVALAALRWPLLGFLASQSVLGASPYTSDADVALYRRLPMPAPPLDPILPTADSGLSAWLRDPAAAADLGAPGSGLADCR